MAALTVEELADELATITEMLIEVTGKLADMQSTNGHGPSLASSGVGAGGSELRAGPFTLMTGEEALALTRKLWTELPGDGWRHPLVMARQHTGEMDGRKVLYYRGLFQRSCGELEELGLMERRDRSIPGARVEYRIKRREA